MRSLLAACLAVLVGFVTVPAWSQTPSPRTAVDDRTEATDLMAQGSALLAQRTPAALREGVTRYEEALRTWQALGESSRQVEALIALAGAHFLLNEKDDSSALLARAGDVALAAGNMPAAIAAYERSLPLFRTAGNRRGEAMALLRAGQASNLLNRPEGFEKGAAYLAKAVPLFDAASDSFNLSYALWGIATANDRLGRKEQARDAYVRALPLFVARGDMPGRARILLSLGEDEQALGSFDSARAYYEQALPLFVSPGDEQSRGLALMGLGSVRESLLDIAGALRAYADAVAVWRLTKDTEGEVTAELKIGALRSSARDWQAALDADRAALTLSEAKGDRSGQATALLAIAGVHQMRGDHRRALDAAARAASLLDGDAFAGQRSVALQSAGDAASALHKNAEALSYLDQVLALSKHNPAGKAAALASEAGVYTAMGNPNKALDLLRQALDIDRAMHNEGAANKVRNDMGLAYATMGRKTEALASFEESLASARESRNLQAQAAILNNLAQIYQGFGDTEQAVDLYLQSLAAARQSGDHGLEPITLSSLGMAYHALGEDTRAFEALESALAIHREFSDHHGEAIVLNNLALVYNDTGDPQKALDSYGRAREAFGNLMEPQNEARALSNIGAVYRGLGAIDRARSYFNEALAIYERNEDAEGWAATLNNMAVLEHSAGEQQKALRWYEQALAVVEKLGNRPEQASLLSGMGVVHSELDEHDQALELLTQSQAIAHEIGDLRAETLALHNLGIEYEQMGDLKQAIDHLRRALLIWQQSHNVEGEAIALFGIARIELRQGLLEASLSHVDDAIRLSESLRSRVGSEDLRASSLARATGAYGLKIDLLMRLSHQHPGQGYDAKALETSERARARSLLDLLSESRANIRRGVDPERLTRETAIKQALSAKELQRAKLSPVGADAQESDRLDHEIDELIAAYEKIQAEIRAASPSYAALTQPQPLALPQIQGLLDPDTLLLEYWLGKDHGYVWAVTPTELHAYELPARAVIESAARHLRDVLRDVANPESFNGASAKLGAILLGPVAADLGRKRLVVISDAALQAAVPFAVVASPNAPPGPLRPLVIDHEIVQEPSASAVAALRLGTAGREPRPGVVAVLADPVFSSMDPRLAAHREKLAEVVPRVSREMSRSVTQNGDLERLPKTLAEAESILKLTTPSQSFSRFGFDASKEAAEDPGLARYRIVHFATHGLLNQRNPELSGLVFSLFKPDGTPDDGYLRLTDVFNLMLPVDLVVLSACESGQGKVVDGEGLVGLTRGFLYAGTARLVVSLWKVNDTATAELMARFYRKMLGRHHLRSAAALRQAQLSMISGRKWKHPSYWAPFIAEGEWR